MATRLGPQARVAIAVVLAVAMQACATTSSVSQVLADPGRYQDRSVRIAGKVTDSVGLLGYGFFRVDDGTGALWVFSRGGLPRQGTHVAVKGSVKDIATVGGYGPVPDAIARALRGGVLMIEETRTVQ